MVTAVASDPYAAVNSAGSAAAQTKNEAGSAERFLKLLVTQLQNQDPLNPMDNAQITSQMAQINTVNGIQQLNTTVEGLNGQFVQLQAMQGAALVGRDITLQGDRMSIADGQGTAGFELGGTADHVKVEVLSPAGRVVDTLNLGAQSAGRHSFNWTGTTAASAPDGANYHFRVVAKQGAAVVASTPLMRDTVKAANTQGDRLTLETLYSGDVAYADVKAFN